MPVKIRLSTSVGRWLIVILLRVRTLECPSLPLVKVNKRLPESFAIASFSATAHKLQKQYHDQMYLMSKKRRI